MLSKFLVQMLNWKQHMSTDLTVTCIHQQPTKQKRF